MVSSCSISLFDRACVDARISKKCLCQCWASRMFSILKKLFQDGIIKFDTQKAHSIVDARKAVYGSRTDSRRASIGLIDRANNYFGCERGQKTVGRN